MDGIAIESVIAIVGSVVVASGGLVVGVISKSTSDKVKAAFAAMEARMGTVETACVDAKQFQKDSITDRGKIHLDIAGVGGDLKVIMERLGSMADQMEYIYKKIYNGGPP